MMIMMTMRMTQSKLYIVNAVSWQEAEIAHLCTLSTNTFFLNNVDDDDDDDDDDDADDDDYDKKDVWSQQCVKMFFFAENIFKYFGERLPG